MLVTENVCELLPARTVTVAGVVKFAELSVRLTTTSLAAFALSVTVPFSASAPGTIWLRSSDRFCNATAGRTSKLAVLVEEPKVAVNVPDQVVATEFVERLAEPDVCPEATVMVVGEATAGPVVVTVTAVFDPGAMLRVAETVAD